MEHLVGTKLGRGQVMGSFVAGSQSTPSKRLCANNALDILGDKGKYVQTENGKGGLKENDMGHLSWSSSEDCSDFSLNIEEGD